VPSLGYHYDPIDYVLRGLVVSNATLWVTNGAVIGVDYAATNHGILLDSGAALKTPRMKPTWLFAMLTWR